MKAQSNQDKIQRIRHDEEDGTDEARGLINPDVVLTGEATGHTDCLCTRQTAAKPRSLKLEPPFSQNDGIKSAREIDFATLASNTQTVKIAP